MKKSTIEEFFNFLNKKEKRGLESLDLGKVIHWKEGMEVLEKHKTGIPVIIRQLLDPKQNPDKVTIKVEGDFSELKILDYIDGVEIHNLELARLLLRRYNRIFHLEATGNVDYSESMDSYLPPVLIVGVDLDIEDSYIYSLPRTHLEVGRDMLVGGSDLLRILEDEKGIWRGIEERGYKVGGEIKTIRPGISYLKFPR